MAALMTGAAFTQVAADPAVSQAVGLQGTTVDEFGVALKGNNPAASHFGLPVVEGDLVQVLLATDNTIYPPQVDGQPDPRNVVLATTRIGLGTSPNQANPATFSSVVSPRPGGNSRIFVRVFNGRTLDSSSFYGDSELFTVRSWKNEVFLGSVASTSNELDPADDDGDGVSNSWEKSHGSDKASADTDGDGLNDHDELLVGTDLLDRSSYFNIEDVSVGPDGRMRLSWDTVPGVTYTVERVSLVNGEAPETLTTLVAETGTLTYSVAEESEGGGFHVYRVTVESDEL
jgi:hypothetical protein